MYCTPNFIEPVLAREVIMEFPREIVIERTAKKFRENGKFQLCVTKE